MDVTRECQQCGGEFVATNPRKVFCSIPCKKAASYRRIATAEGRTLTNRRTPADIARLKAAIYDIAAEQRPMSTRQIYYVGIGRLWEKDEGGDRTSYKLVNSYVGEMREDGEMPWDWITDSTRLVRIAEMYDSVEDALTDVASFYRRDLWRSEPTHVEVWCESDSIASVLYPITHAEGIGLYSCRGHAGKGFVYDSVQSWLNHGKPVKVLYVGDWDPSGMAIPRSVAERMDRYTDGEVELDFERLAVTPDDVRFDGLQDHGVNTKDVNYRRFADLCRAEGLDPTRSIEVEAIPPNRLRDRLRSAIFAQHADPHRWDVLRAAEESEREVLARMIPTFVEEVEAEVEDELAERGLTLDDDD